MQREVMKIISKPMATITINFLMTWEWRIFIPITEQEIKQLPRNG